ncbi:MAG: DUF5107 domain-containing protein [Anaerolineae bacterium]|nr:DUF5107 domain-containing protein [Anaerolineae bacterium]
MPASWAGRVECRAETILIPTYGVGQPDKNPMFLEKRVYQGSSGVVYPYPVIDRVADTSQPQPYEAIFLENRYLLIMLLPALGGRVQMALDKTSDYHFIYYNRVIKPALVGLAGPWISGGIEFNWPQHHRPNTFEPVAYHLESQPDGSQTVWFNDVERMFRTRSTVGLTLHPDVAYLELNVQLYNRTDTPQTFLWWANPAVHVNDDYQSVFPPDVHAVMDHGRRAVSDFPIATGTYYKVNYAPGTDISRYKNIPVPTSFMAYHSDFDFIGCYDHGRRAGMMHIANHHLVPGKKQWTWGNGAFGQAWDRQLTDEDGPYIELMCGAFTDNQPDFSWLQPGEEKRFQQIFMPYKHIGAAKNASSEAVLNLEVAAETVAIGVYVTRPRRVQVELWHQGAVYRRWEADLSPEEVLQQTVPLRAIPQQVTLRVCAADGRELLRFTPLPDEKPAIPQPATAAPPPAEVASAEELFLHGLHLEQYRHATYAPEPYYAEALRRDPGDSRCNHALGRLLLQRGCPAEAEPYLRRAVARQTLRNPNPYDGEALYHLGLALRMQGRDDEAWDVFYKAVWNAGVRAGAYFELGRIACRRGDPAGALPLLEEALQHNQRHHQARHLQVLCLRKLNQTGAALAAIDLSLAQNPYNAGALYEHSRLTGTADLFQQRMQGRWYDYLELALDYVHAGQYDEAMALLRAAPPDDPLLKYYLAWCCALAGDEAGAQTLFVAAAQQPPDYGFPNCVEAVPALTMALARNPQDGRAAYYLGNFWYAHRRYDEAIAAWRTACEREPAFATPYRNLGLAYMNKRHDAAAAQQAYARAFALNPADARVLFELDQLAKKQGVPPAERWQRLAQHLPLVQQRDDLLLEYISLLNMQGEHSAALAALLAHTFHPWEGGEGKVAEQYVLSRLHLAQQALAAGDAAGALAHLAAAGDYPPNLNEGRLTGADNHLQYYLGVVQEHRQNPAAAQGHYQQAAQGPLDPSSSLYYNDRPPDLLLYQGLAWQRLGQPEQARAIFTTLVAYGRDHLEDEVQMDYFAVSLPNFLVFEDDLTRRHRCHCHYMQALGYMGLGEAAAAQAQLAALAALDPNHIGAAAHPRLLAVAQGLLP